MCVCATGEEGTRDKVSPTRDSNHGYMRCSFSLSLSSVAQYTISYISPSLESAQAPRRGERVLRVGRHTVATVPLEYFVIKKKNKNKKKSYKFYFFLFFFKKKKKHEQINKRGLVNRLRKKI